MKVTFIGWRESDSAEDLSRSVGLEVERLRPDALNGRFPDCTTVIVLGRHVQETLDPESVARLLECYGGSTLVLTGAPDAGMWSLEAAAGIGEPVSIAMAFERVREIVSDRPLPRMSLVDWLGDRRLELSTEDRHLVRLVAGLPRLRGYEWAVAAGISEHRLSVATRRLFGTAAGAVLRAYRIRAALQLRTRGVTMEAIAPVLGYASRASVSRALRTHRMTEQDA